MDSTFVYRPGTKTIIGDDISGTITGVMIKFDAVEYNVSWWNGREYKTDWFPSKMINVDVNQQTLKVGFK